MTYEKKASFKFRPGGQLYQFSVKETLFMEKLIAESPKMVNHSDLARHCKTTHDNVRRMASDLRAIITFEGGVLDTVNRQGYRLGKFEVFS